MNLPVHNITDEDIEPSFAYDIVVFPILFLI